jgi:hypothetical protein
MRSLNRSSWRWYSRKNSRAVSWSRQRPNPCGRTAANGGRRPPAWRLGASGGRRMPGIQRPDRSGARAGAERPTGVLPLASQYGQHRRQRCSGSRRAVSQSPAPAARQAVEPASLRWSVPTGLPGYSVGEAFRGLDAGPKSRPWTETSQRRGRPDPCAERIASCRLTDGVVGRVRLSMRGGSDGTPERGSCPQGLRSVRQGRHGDPPASCSTPRASGISPAEAYWPATIAAPMRSWGSSAGRPS